MNESVASVSKVDLVLMGYTVTRAIYWKKWRCEQVMDSCSCRIKKWRENWSMLKYYLEGDEEGGWCLNLFYLTMAHQIRHGDPSTSWLVHIIDRCSCKIQMWLVSIIITGLNLYNHSPTNIWRRVLLLLMCLSFSYLHTFKSLISLAFHDTTLRCCLNELTFFRHWRLC